MTATATYAIVITQFSSAVLAYLLPSHYPPHRCHELVKLTRRRIHGNGDSAGKVKSLKGVVGEREHHDHELSNTQTNGHMQTHSHGLRRTLTLTFACHDGHDYGGGLIKTPQSGGAPWSQISLLCIAMFTYHIFLMYRLPPSSLAIRFPVSL